jgi:hypothetical protein
MIILFHGVGIPDARLIQLRAGGYERLHGSGISKFSYYDYSTLLF